MELAKCPSSCIVIILLSALPLAHPSDAPLISNVKEDCKSLTSDTSPVCGSDDITYSTESALMCANKNGDKKIEVAFRGNCSDPCWQALNPDAVSTGTPICSSDGIIYPNEITWMCTKQQPGKGNMEVLDMQECKTKNLTEKFDPCAVLAYVGQRHICGSDNVTYNNVWHMICTSNMYKVENLKIEKIGKCNIECPYSAIYNPVCSTLEYMYANAEALKCRQLLSPYIKNEFHHHGHCARHLHQNPCYVDNSYRAVCASNGRTYSSPNYVRCLKEINLGLNILHSGPCTVDEVKKILGATEACASAAHYHEWNPICGSDNNTYGNPYRFLCAALNKTDLQVLYSGECGGFDYCRLKDTAEGETSKVCGNDGTTYANIHSLYCAQTHKKHLQLSHTGECAEADDPCLYRGTPFLDNSGNPICASNGVTYVSPQAVWCAAKTDGGIEFRHDGECF